MGIAATKITPIADHQVLQGERFSCCEEGFRVPKKVQQAPGPSRNGVSAAGSGNGSTQV